MKALLPGLVAVVALFACNTAWAHKPSTSYLRLERSGPQELAGRWDIALRDLEFAIGLDANADNAITWGELKARREALFAYALARLDISTEGNGCTLTPGPLKVTEHTDGGYAVLYFDVDCPAPVARFTAAYHLFAEIDPSHRGLLQVRGDGLTQTAVLGPRDPTVDIALAEASYWHAFIDYLSRGIHHIRAGTDHVLFVITFLLPSVLFYRNRRWRPRERAGSAVREVAEVVTGFTVGHSITLAVAVLGIASLPGRLVGSAIALSIVLMALNNLYPVVPRARWALAFTFGLAHGFGFASVLINLDLPRSILALALFAFNLGVEIGQLTIVVLVLPMAIMLRHTAFYRIVVLYGGSLVVAALASVWLYQRALGV